MAFISEMYGETDLRSWKPIYIRSWLASLKDAGISSRSINRKVSSLKTFFLYLVRQEVIETSPLAAIKGPKTGKRLPQFVDARDLETLFTHVEFPDDWMGKTSRLVMGMLYSTGMRKAELVGLEEKHIDFANSTIRVWGKGNKERLIPIDNQLAGLLKEYIGEKKRIFSNPAPQLFLREDGKSPGPRGIYSIVNKYLSLVTTIDKKSPHILRHSFATHLMNNGADLNAVKELLGHSSLAATQVYTHNSIEKLKDIHKKAHPRS
jgi:integrase/recombinase XerC